LLLAKFELTPVVRYSDYNFYPRQMDVYLVGNATVSRNATNDDPWYDDLAVGIECFT